MIETLKNKELFTLKSFLMVLFVVSLFILSVQLIRLYKDRLFDKEWFNRSLSNFVPNPTDDDKERTWRVLRTMFSTSLFLFAIYHTVYYIVFIDHNLYFSLFKFLQESYVYTIIIDHELDTLIKNARLRGPSRDNLVLFVNVFNEIYNTDHSRRTLFHLIRTISAIDDKPLSLSALKFQIEAVEDLNFVYFKVLKEEQRLPVMCECLKQLSKLIELKVKFYRDFCPSPIL